MPSPDWGRRTTPHRASPLPVACARRGHTGTLIGLAYDTGDTGLYSRELFDRIYLIPYPSSGAGPLLDSLRKVQEETGLALVLPTLDSEMDVYLAVQEELTALGHSLLSARYQGFETAGQNSPGRILP